jgi:hypothetical protein
MNEAELQQAYEARLPALNAMGLWVTHVIIMALEEQLGSHGAVAKFRPRPFAWCKTRGPNALIRG